MKSMIQVMVLLSVMVLLAGCNSMAKWQEAMAQDPATITGRITSIYGTAQFVRIGKTESGQTISADPDGVVTVSGPPVSE